MSRPVCGNCMCLEDETGCGCTEMKQEPVAWIINEGDKQWLTEEIEPHEKEHSIPLYTKPQYRELSDDEIKEIALNHAMSDCFYIDFARAILKKASEK